MFPGWGLSIHDGFNSRLGCGSLPAMGIDLKADLMAIASALSDRELPYALVGAFALAVHGAPRATTDIDLIVRPDDLDAVKAAVAPLGFILEALPMVFSDGMHLRRVTKVAQGEAVTLDLILLSANLRPVWESRRKLETELGALWVISRDALIQMKLNAGRLRDLADIERLKELDR